MKIYLREFSNTQGEIEAIKQKCGDLPYYKQDYDVSEFDPPGISDRSTTVVIPFFGEKVFLCIADSINSTDDYTHIGGNIDFRKLKTA